MASENTLLEKVLSLQDKFASLQEQLSSPEVMGDMKRYEEKLYGLECIQCGSCTYVCPAKRPLTQAFKQTKAEILARKRAEAGGKK